MVLKTFLSLHSVNIYDWFWLLIAHWTGSNPYFQRFEKRSSRSSRNNDLVEDIFQEFFTFWLIFGSENVLIFLFCELLRLISIAASLLNRPLPLVSTFWKKKQPFQQKERFGRWPFFKNFGPQNTFIFKILLLIYVVAHLFLLDCLRLLLALHSLHPGLNWKESGLQKRVLKSEKVLGRSPF